MRKDKLPSKLHRKYHAKIPLVSYVPTYLLGPPADSMQPTLTVIDIIIFPTSPLYSSTSAILLEKGRCQSKGYIPDIMSWQLLCSGFLAQKGNSVHLQTVLSKVSRIFGALLLLSILRTTPATTTRSNPEAGVEICVLCESHARCRSQ